MIYYDLAVVLYILSLLLLLINFYLNRPIVQTLQTLFTSIAIIANVSQILILRHLMRGSFVVQDWLMLVSLSLAVVYLLINLKYKRPYVGFFLLPMIILIGFAAIFMRGEVKGPSLALQNMWLYIHIPLVTIGTAFFLTAFATGLMYFIMEKQLKAKKFGRIFDRFPPLATIDKINTGALYLGFAFYTAGLFSVLGWIHYRMIGLTIDFAFFAKMFTGVLVWIVCGVIILLKNRRGLNAKQTALASIIGFAAVLVTYISVILFVVK